MTTENYHDEPVLLTELCALFESNYGAETCELTPPSIEQAARLRESGDL